MPRLRGIAPRMPVSHHDSPVPQSLAPFYFGFVLTGIVTVLLGPLLPALTALWQLNDTQAGYFFTAQFLGSTIGVGLTSWLVPRFGFRLPLVAAYCMMAIGASVLPLGPWTLGWACVFCYGIGIGLAIPATNLLVASTRPDARASILSLLNAAWGLGAVLCAPLLALARQRGSVRLFFWLLAFVLAAEAFFFLFYSRTFALPTDNTASPSGESKPTLASLIILGILFFTYVGTESSIGGWLALYTQRSMHTTDAAGGFMTSVFWMALLLGRAGSSLLLKHASELRFVRGNLVIASAGMLCLLTNTHFSVMALGVVLAGLGLAAVYPITISFLSHLGVNAGRISGIMFALAGFGGAILPALVGRLSSNTGSLRFGLFVPLISGTIMLILYLAAPPRHAA
jgi:fucose permease